MKKAASVSLVLMRRLFLFEIDHKFTCHGAGGENSGEFDQEETREEASYTRCQRVIPYRMTKNISGISYGITGSILYEITTSISNKMPHLI
jgi:hypothetical protein